jgi:membrane protease YdiL (CAAX protease family)
VVAYTATAVFEETLWRGVMLGMLRPTGVWRAALISSLLFGLGHLGNTALRGVSFLIVLQAFGAALQGIGLAALRLRTNTIWPLIGIHALHDLFLQMSTLPIPLLEAFIETVICIYGIVLLRHHADRSEPSGQAHETPAVQPGAKASAAEPFRIAQARLTGPPGAVAPADRRRSA